MKKFEDLILTYKDFPKKGIDFKDVLEIIQYPDIFQELILKMSSHQFLKNAEAIISIDARGFIFGSAISLQVSKPMIVARKPGKLPGELIEKNYSLEYGENTLSIQKKALQKYNSYAIVDDLLATGGTVNCISKILKSVNKEVTGLLIVVELMKLEGRSKLNYPIESFVKIWLKDSLGDFYITPNEPAIKPAKTKNENSARSLGSELTIRFNWVIWPCAPQVTNFFFKI